MSNKNRGTNRPDAEVKPAAPVAPAVPEVKDVVESADAVAAPVDVAGETSGDVVETTGETGNDTQEGAEGSNEPEAPAAPQEESKPEEGVEETVATPEVVEPQLPRGLESSIVHIDEAAFLAPVGELPDALVAPAVVVDETAPAITFAEPEPVVLSSEETITQFVNDMVDEYYEAMRPGKPVTEAQGKLNQRLLLRIYQAVLAREESEFHYALTALLNRVHLHRDDVFHEEYIFRFKAAAAFEANMGKFFESFTSFLKRIADPESRTLRIQQEVNHSVVLDRISNEEQRARLHGYLVSFL